MLHRSSILVRPAFWCVFVLLAACGFAPRLFASAPVTDRRVELIYQSDIIGIPQGAKRLEAWVPLAPSTPNQMIEEREIMVPALYEVIEERRFKNPMIHFEVTAPPDSLGVKVRYRAKVWGDRGPVYEAPANGHTLTGEERALALTSDRLMVVDERLTVLSREITRGAATDLDKARAIYDFVVRSVSYDKSTPGWGRGDTLRACDIKKGNCTDFHSLFISLARAQGIPARFQMGVPLPEDVPSGAVSGYHCWAEFFLQGRGWVPVDASEAWKQPQRRETYFGTYVPNRMLLVTGRDFVLSPRQGEDPLNLWVAPYVEVDGVPLADVRVMFSFALLES